MLSVDNRKMKDMDKQIKQKKIKGTENEYYKMIM
jgi:hypothetical protein